MQEITGTTFDLLWPEGQPPEDAYWLRDESVRDLGVDRLLAALVPDERRREPARRALYHLGSDPSVIRYRQDVIADLLAHPDLARCLEDLLPGVEALERGPYVAEFDSTLYEVTWRAGELETVVESVGQLSAAFAGIEGDLRSEGLRGLREVVAAVENDPTFHQLVEELPMLLRELRTRASVTIGVNLDHMLRPVEAVLLSVNEQPFTSGSLFDVLFGRDDAGGIAPLHSLPRRHVEGQYALPVHGDLDSRWAVEPKMVPLFRDLGEVLEKASQPIAKALRQYNRITSRFLITLKDAILFYVGAARLIRRFEEAGLPVCRPEIAPAEERIYRIEGCVNANLAIHLLNRGRDDLSGAIVPNDVTFDDAGRIIILTGPNRGGKTTYIQAIGLAQVMAQAGLYVPGRWARISPVDGIYTHYPVEERLEHETGRFGDEARRLHEVFAHVTPYSLVLLNESLSSTNPGESLYLARDLIRVLRMVGARAVFVTHLHELAENVDRLNDDTPGDSRIVSMVASRITPDMLAELDGEAEAARSYRVVHSPPVGRSFARQIATRYGVSYEQLVDLLRSRGVLP